MLPHLAELYAIPNVLWTVKVLLPHAALKSLQTLCGTGFGDVEQLFILKALLPKFDLNTTTPIFMSCSQVFQLDDPTNTVASFTELSIFILDKGFSDYAALKQAYHSEMTSDTSTDSAFLTSCIYMDLSARMEVVGHVFGWEIYDVDYYRYMINADKLPDYVFVDKGF